MGGRFLNGILAGAVFGAAILMALSLISPPPPREEAPPEPVPEVADTVTEAPAQSGAQPEELPEDLPEAPAQGQGGQGQEAGISPPLGLLDPSGTLHSPGYPSGVDGGPDLLFPPPPSLIPGEGAAPALPGPALAEGVPAATAQPAQPPDLTTGAAPAALVPGLIAGDTVPPGAPGGDTPAAGNRGAAVPADVPFEELPRAESDPGEAPAELADESPTGTAAPAGAAGADAESAEGAAPSPHEATDGGVDAGLATVPGMAGGVATPEAGTAETLPEAAEETVLPEDVSPGEATPKGETSESPSEPMPEGTAPEAALPEASPEVVDEAATGEEAAPETGTAETLPEAAEEAVLPEDVPSGEATPEGETSESPSEPLPEGTAPEAVTPEASPEVMDEAATGDEAAPEAKVAEPPEEEALPESAAPESSSATELPEAEGPEDAMPDGAQSPEVRRIIPGEGASTLPSTPPLIAPDPAVSEGDSGAALTPADGEVGATEPDAALGPLNEFAAPFDNPGGKPVLSIVLIDTGEATLDRAALAALPFPVTFALDPLDPAAAGHAALYRTAGKEVAMLATGFPKGAQASDVEVALAAMELALPETVAVMDLPERRFQADRPLASLVVPAVAASGRGLLSWNEGLNAAEQVAEREGAPAAVIFRNLDAEGEGAPAIARYLDRAVFKAAQEGAVIVAGHTRPETVAALLEWSIGARAALVALAPASAVLRLGEGG